MKGNTAYDEAIDLLSTLLIATAGLGDLTDKEKQAAKRAREIIEARKKYLESHFRAVFFAMSNKNGKRHAFFEFSNDTSDEDINEELESWAEELNTGWSYTKAAWIKLEDGQEFEYPDYNSF